MQKKQKMIPLTQLNLTNRFLFDEVVDDPQTHQDILAIILGDDVPPLKQNSTEKEHRTLHWPILSAWMSLPSMSRTPSIIRKCRQRSGTTFRRGAVIISL